MLVAGTLIAPVDDDALIRQPIEKKSMNRAGGGILPGGGFMRTDQSFKNLMDKSGDCASAPRRF